jgi:hypothetical protein
MNASYKLILRALLVLLPALPTAAQAVLLNASAQPAQRQLLPNQDNNWAVNWRVTADSSHSVGAASPVARIVNPSGGATLATVGGTLSQGGSGPFMFGEFIAVPQATVQAWQASGLRRVLLVRDFADLSGAGSVRGQQVLTLPVVASGALRAVQIQPAQRQLLASQNNPLSLAWQVVASEGYSSGVSSVQAQVVDPASGTVLATLGGRLAAAGAGPFLLREELELPAAEVEGWRARGLRRLLLQREFIGGSSRLRGQVTLNLVSSGLRAPRENRSGELLVQRLSLSFTDNQRIKVVPPATDLMAKVLLAYSGNGLLEGRWQVAEPGSTEGKPIYRTLTLVRSYLRDAQQSTLNSPPLPTDKAGKYRVRFCVTNRELVPADALVLDSGCPLDSLTVETVYEVLGANDPVRRPLIDAAPQDGAVDSASQFHWQPVAGAVVYQLQLFSADGERSDEGEVLGESPNFVAGMLLPASVNRTALSALLRSKLEPGRYYLWRVTAHDQGGVMIGRSQEWRVRYQP